MKTTHISGMFLLRLITVITLSFLVQKSDISAQEPPVLTIKDSSGVASACVTSNGDLVLRGQAFPNQATITLNSANKYYKVCDSNNSVVFAIDCNSGNAYAKGEFVEFLSQVFSSGNTQTFDNGFDTICAAISNAGKVQLMGDLITNANWATMQPNIETHPVSLVRNYGQTAIFTIAASGQDPLYYQWMKNGQALSSDDALTTQITLTSLTNADEGAYSCLIGNLLGYVQSNTANLTVNDPIVTGPQPTQQTVLYGSELNLSVVAQGASNLTYQWFQNGAALVDSDSISGASEAALKVFPVKTGGLFYCQVSCGSKTVNSSTAAVSIQSLPGIVTYSMNTIAENIPMYNSLGEISRYSSFDSNGFTVTDVIVTSIDGSSRSLGSTAAQVERTGPNTFRLIWLNEPNGIQASTDSFVQVVISYKASENSQTLSTASIKLDVIPADSNSITVPFYMNFPYGSSVLVQRESYKSDLGISYTFDEFSEASGFFRKDFEERIG